MPDRICPILTAANMVGQSKSEKSLIVGAPGAGPVESDGPEGVSCVRDQCQWWMSHADQSGKIVGGDCSIPSLLHGFTALANKATVLTDAIQSAANVPVINGKKG